MFIFCLILFPSIILGQQIIANDTITRESIIGYDINGNQVSFNPKNPPLIPIAGAPKPFYTHYWEFGDGNYSFEEKPTHIYKNTGEFETHLWTTNNYDNGKAPTSRPKKVAVNNLPHQYNDVATLDEYDGFRLQKNREAIPNEEMVFIMSYKNELNYTASGKLYLFYNEQKYKSNNFEIIDTRTYHNEREALDEITASNYDMNDSNTFLASAENEFLHIKTIQQDSVNKQDINSTIEESKVYYKDWNILEFDNMPPGEERTVFHTIKTTPEMLKDTSAIVTLRGVYVPDRSYGDHKVKDLELEIVTSHDPNKMSNSSPLLNYRLVRFKRLKYKVRFQNDGEGPARTIKLEVDIPEMFDKTTLEVEDMYPKCEICPKNKAVNYSCLDTTFTKDQAIFTFKNIYLPGTSQKNVKEKDSTKGFVKYSIKFGENFHKKKTKSRTAIIFDKNDPIITNYSTTRFTPGISIGAKAGYSYYPKLNNSKEYFVGATISPYKSYRAYLQTELMFSSSSFDELLNTETIEVINTDVTDIIRSEENNDYKSISAYLVPASFRYNITSYLGFGIGPQLKIDFSQKKHSDRFDNYYIRTIGANGEVLEFENPDRNSNESIDSKKSFSDFRAGIFADLNLGIVRIGPSAGIRYVHYFEAPYNQWHFYAAWKF